MARDRVDVEDGIEFAVCMKGEEFIGQRNFQKLRKGCASWNQSLPSQQSHNSHFPLIIPTLQI